MKIIDRLTQILAARLFSHTPTPGFKQKGVSALEYVVLAAVIVIAVSVGAVLLAGEGEKDGPIYKAFDSVRGAITGDDPAGNP